MEEVSSNKINKGKRRITIEPIQSKSKRQVAFSRRRKGLFKKASELCTVFGAEVAIVTFSNAGKPYSFSHPTNNEAIIERFINGNNNNNNNSNNTDCGNAGAIKFENTFSTDHHHHQQSMNYNKNFDASGEGGYWWDQPVDNLGLAELENFEIALKGLREQVVSKLDHEISSVCQSSLSNVSDDDDYSLLDMLLAGF